MSSKPDEPFHRDNADLDIFSGCTVSRHDSDVEGNVGVPLPMLTAGLHPFNVAYLRDDWKNDLFEFDQEKNDSE